MNNPDSPMPQLGSEYVVEVVPRKSTSARKSPVSRIVNDRQFRGVIVFIDDSTSDLAPGTRCRVVVQSLTRSGQACIGSFLGVVQNGAS